MNAAYYAKLLLFLLLSSLGGLAGAVFGAAIGYLAGMVAVFLFTFVTYSFDPLTVGFYTLFLSAIVGFIWAFVRSYTLLVRHLW
ncbi:hypothetical protein [Microvirga lenta]|uniref:hypothetical protein n=1 Tax=Microvirga lenta TaxID=2881337 RepID=UPI001CFFF6DD|nr:hypothetical protein [Microvirga lenta]MCB5176609.1 hypothetical protein [Microvirga lenta]